MAGRRQRVPVIVGPTAVGKTAVAVALARHWPLVVISADSRQIYRGLDLGTGKPTPAELAAVPHLGVDLLDPGQRYSAGRFARDAAQWLGALPPGPMPVVVGGTGLYIRALADGLFREPPLDPERRARLAGWTSRADGLGRWAARLDPEYAGGGRQRAARTVEVALLTGRPLSWWQRRARAEGVMRPWYVRLALPRAVLHQRIGERVARMLSAGWVDEVRRVLATGIDAAAPGLDALGYRDIVRHLQGALPADRLEQAIVTSTRRYAKRQETWFRHQLGRAPVVTLDATESREGLAARIAERWERER
ncbi:MAG: tRNA (adenosine(37)-N6)-dimethylallyltransferase MiaA [Gemmatimonadetes bacterium]|nr:tRNA (adenosine(37)-N6)-dimethylallyltransferase MiaA [Gemmatimonadota bacterium]MBI2537891.1 tRNA (adenosine(37)-N6)-dimethylallyltransferase MiaA [Gemmatimonadota bacterium]